MPQPRSAFRQLLPLLLAALAACGGDDAPGTGPAAAAELRLSDTTATTMTMLVAHVRDGGAATATLSALLDTTATPVVVIDDSTVAVPVPVLPAGRYQLSLRLGSRTLTTPVRVAAAPTVADPAGYVDSVLTGLVRSLDRQAALFADTARRPAGVDSVTYVQGLDAARAAVAGLRTEFAALSTDEQRQLAAALRANDRALGVTALLAGAPGLPAAHGMLMAGDGACINGQSCIETMFEFIEFGRDVTIAYLGVRGAIEVGSWFAGPAGKLFAKFAQVGLSAGWLYFQFAELTDHLNRPAAVERVKDPADDQLRSRLRGELATSSTPVAPASLADVDRLVLRAGVARALTVRGEYRSVIAADVASSSAVAALDRALGALRSVWNRVAGGIPGFSLPAPALAAAPRRRADDIILPQFLKVEALSLAGATATTRASGTDLAVTVENERQGDDHPVTFALRYVAPGMPTRAVTVPVQLFPEQYRVLTLDILPETATVRKGGTRQFERVPRDSSGDVIHDSLLVGRATTWASSRTATATVDGTGLVTGVDTGTVVISATLDGRRADRSTRVGGSLFVRFTQFGYDPSPTTTALGDGWYRFSCSPTYLFEAYDPQGFTSDPPVARVVGFEYRMVNRATGALLIRERKDIPVDQQWEVNGNRAFQMTWSWTSIGVTYFDVYTKLFYRDLRDGLVYESPEAYEYCPH